MFLLTHMGAATATVFARAFQNTLAYALITRLEPPIKIETGMSSCNYGGRLVIITYVSSMDFRDRIFGCGACQRFRIFEFQCVQMLWVRFLNSWESFGQTTAHHHTFPA